MARKSREKEKTRHEDTPAHIVAQNLYDGEWGSLSRLTLRAFIRPEIVPLKVNVLGVLLIQAFGFETELAVVMRRLKRFEVYEESTTLYRKYEKPGDDGSVLVTEVMTSNSIAVKLFEFWMEDYADSGYEPSKQRIAEMKKARQELRKVFEVLEDDGWIERARLNCRPQKLVGIGYEKLVADGLVTPLGQLTKAELRKLGGRNASVGIFLLARPRPAKSYGKRDSYVGKVDYISHDNPNDFNADAFAAQLFLDLGNEFGIDPALLKKRPEIQKQVDRVVAIEQRTQRDEDAKQREKLKLRGMVELAAREAGSPTFSGKQKDLNFAKTSLPAQPDKEQKASAVNPNGHSKKMSPPQVPSVEGSSDAATAEKTSASPNPNGTRIAPLVTTNPPLSRGDAETPIMSKAEFNDTLCVRFHDVKAGLPTQKQTDAIYAALGANCQAFLDWLTPLEMQRRKPQHGGVLPLLLEEFSKLQALPEKRAPEPELVRMRREASYGD